jgi:hypothetical protein
MDTMAVTKVLEVEFRKKTRTMENDDIRWRLKVAYEMPKNLLLTSFLYARQTKANMSLKIKHPFLSTNLTKAMCSNSRVLGLGFKLACSLGLEQKEICRARILVLQMEGSFFLKSRR